MLSSESVDLMVVDFDICAMGSSESVYVMGDGCRLCPILLVVLLTYTAISHRRKQMSRGCHTDTGRLVRFHVVQEFTFGDRNYPVS